MSIDDVLSGKAQFAVVCGDATAVMATLPDECVGVSYFDPPYGLSAQSTENIVECLTAWLAGKVYTHKSSGFMGSSWDAFTPGPEVFREVHRALRPGGYCVAFSSTRTVDLLGIAVRLAGFDVRPGWAWVQGGGFPKSLNVSIACDRDAGEVRDVVGVRESFRPNTQPMRDPSGFQDRSSGNVTVPSSPAAVQWDGYGTDVKPAFEPLIVARKALEGTVAGNVQKHGCGALNIDAARIGATGGTRKGTFPNGDSNGVYGDGLNGACEIVSTGKGRFPAALALVHDEGCVCEGTRRIQGNGINEGGGTRPGGFGNVGADKGSSVPCAPGYADPDGMESIDAWTCTDTCAVAELGRQSGERPSTLSRFGIGGPNPSATVSDAGMFGGMGGLGSVYGDTGTAARFYYQAKASASDRLAYITCTAGCAHHESVAFQKDARDSARDPSREHPRGFCRACNGVRTHHQHSTVKPLDLAKYHARLLSLPAHTKPIALVPFCGSGVEARALLDVGFRVIAIDQDYRYCAMTEFRLSHKEPDCDVAKRDALVESERGDWTKPIRTSKSTDPIAVGKQLPLFGKKD